MKIGYFKEIDRKQFVKRTERKILGFQQNNSMIIIFDITTVKFPRPLI